MPIGDESNEFCRDPMDYATCSAQEHQAQLNKMKMQNNWNKIIAMRVDKLSEEFNACKYLWTAKSNSNPLLIPTEHCTISNNIYVPGFSTI